MNATVTVSSFKDSLYNWVSGLGTQKDKSTHSRYVFLPLDKDQLDASYRGDWIARKAVDIPAQDATRAWRAWQAEKDQITAIEKAEKLFGIKHKVRAALIRGRLYGGGLIVMGVNQGSETAELNIDKVKKDSLKFVHVVSRHEVSCGQMIRNVDSPWYGEPEYYERRTRDGRTIRVHPSRVVRFIGNEVPELDAASDTWGDSILQAVDGAIKGAGLVAGGIAAMIDEMKVDIIGMPNFNNIVTTKQGRDALTARFAYANTAKSIVNALVMDSAEKWERTQLDINGMPDLIKAYLVIASGAVDIPSTRFLSQSPSGMDATGESDTDNYHDKVSSEQENIIEPPLSRLDEVLLRHVFGTRDEGIHFNWRPLRQMSEDKKSKIAKAKADTFKIDHDAGLLPDAVMAEARANQLIEDGTYPGLDMALEDFDYENFLGAADEPKPEPLPPPMLPGQPPGGPQPALPRPGQKLLPAPAKAAKATDAATMVRRWHKRVRDSSFTDAKQRTLYVRRNLLNTGEFIDWARGQGFKSVMPASELHVTVLYSKQPVDWMKMGGELWSPSDEGKLIVQPGGPRIVEPLGNEGAVVLLFSSSQLMWRHEDMKRSGASSDYDEYQPHITITYEQGGVDLEQVVPYRGQLTFGPEIFEEITQRWHAEVEEVET